MNPLARFRDWWFSPVVSRLDRIEANTRPATFNVVPNSAVDKQPADMNAIARSVAVAVRGLRAPLRPGDPTEFYRRAGYSREEC